MTPLIAIPKNPDSLLMKTACLISGAVLGAIVGVICFLFGLWVVGRILDLSPGSHVKEIDLLYLFALSIIGSAVVGGILGRRAANHRRIAIVLMTSASVLAVATAWFIRHAPP
jgi:hypothetical protein